MINIWWSPKRIVSNCKFPYSPMRLKLYISYFCNCRLYNSLILSLCWMLQNANTKHVNLQCYCWILYMPANIWYIYIRVYGYPNHCSNIMFNKLYICAIYHMKVSVQIRLGFIIINVIQNVTIRQHTGLMRLLINEIPATHEWTYSLGLLEDTVLWDLWNDVKKGWEHINYQRSFWQLFF